MLKLKFRKFFVFSEKEIDEKKLEFVSKRTFSKAPIHKRNKKRNVRRKMAKASRTINR